MPLRLCLSLCLLMKPRVACSYMHACFRVGRRSHACLACLVHHGFVSARDYLHKHLRLLSLWSLVLCLRTCMLRSLQFVAISA